MIVKYKKYLFTALVLCLSLSSGTHLAFAGQSDPETPAPDRIEKMLNEGWRPVAEGLLQRSRGENTPVESFAYGREGFIWLEQELRRQYGRMLAEYEAYPSKKLARVIERQKKEILRIQKALLNNEIPDSQEKVTVNGCDVSYGAHADAYPRTDVQGVGATADSYFSANCGKAGHTEAYAYVRATLNGTTSTHSVFDPSDSYSGEYVRSDASWSLQGGPDCYSQASASINSVALGISYSVFDENYQCPPPPLKVSISGPSYDSIYGYDCHYLTWTASASGGVPPYSYQWYRNGYPVGSGSSYSEYICGSNYNYWESFTISVTATDAASSQASNSLSVWIDYYQNYNNCDPYNRYQFCPYQVEQ
jgi:hypothetical protein